MKTLIKVPYVDLAEQHASIKDEIMDAVSHVLDHGKFILGQEVAEFERVFADMNGSRFALGVGSGTDALIMSLKVNEIGLGDEVITPANSFISSTSCIKHVGAEPVLVDVNEDYLLDPQFIENAITPNTKAILPVHWTGKPANMDAINAIAEKHGLFIIEDCAQAVCAEYKGRKVGSIGNIGCFSLHPLKTLNACGDGGVITTNDADVYKKLIVLRDNGFESPGQCVAWSNNSRLDTIQAAILLVKMKYLDQWTEERRANAQYYQKQFAKLNQVHCPVDHVDEKSVYHTFIVQAERRDQLKAFLEENGIGTKIHYATPIHLQPIGQDLGYSQGDLPVTEQQAQRILSLPIYHNLHPEQREHVVKTVFEFYGESTI